MAEVGLFLVAFIVVLIVLNWAGVLFFAKPKRFEFTQGYHPKKDAPIYRYWCLGVIEIRWAIQSGDFISLELDRDEPGQGFCHKCHIEITRENDSRWRDWTEEGWLPVCTDCYETNCVCFRCGVKLKERDTNFLFFINDSPFHLCQTHRLSRHHWTKESGLNIQTAEEYLDKAA